MKTTEQRWAIVEPYADSADEYVLLIADGPYQTRATIIEQAKADLHFAMNGDSWRTFKRKRGMRVVRVSMRWPRP